MQLGGKEQVQGPLQQMDHMVESETQELCGQNQYKAKTGLGQSQDPLARAEALGQREISSNSDLMLNLATLG